MIIVSVPGKIHLMGEHAIVHGKPALLAAINLRLSVTISESTGGIILHVPEGEEYIRHILEVTRKNLGLEKLPNMEITISSKIPSGYHLGSSAATAVGVAGAVMYFTRKIWNPDRINQIAYEAEKKQHGNPSGGDNTTVTYGGFIWFRKELEFLRSIWKFPFPFPSELNHFFLISTGRPKETTGEMVALVSEKLKVKSQKLKMEKTFSENEVQTKRIAGAIKTGDEATLLDAIRKGERTLENMGVVSDTVVPIMRSIEHTGGAVKILGGGGKSGPVGFLLCYHHDPKKVEALCKPLGYAIQQIELGEEGVRLESRG